jgi:putative sporulation protein YtaF
MSISFTLFIEAFILVIALSVDAFVASFAYGTDKIKIPASSILIINSLCSGILVLFLLIGGVLRPLLPPKAVTILCFLILLILGIAKLFDSSIKILIKKFDSTSKKIQFSLKRITFILTVYADPQTADIDKSNILSPAESISLGIALSLDSAVVGLGAGVSSNNFLLILMLSFAIGFLAIYLGDIVGEKIASKTSLNLSWISGTLLIILAFLKIW